MQEIPLKAVSRHVKDKNLTRNSHHGFLKDKVCPTNLVNFGIGVTDSEKDKVGWC